LNYTVGTGLRALALLAILVGPSRAQSVSPAYDPLGLPPLPEGTIASNNLAPPRVGGYVQFRETMRSYIGPTANVPRARVGVDGPLPMRFSYRVLVEYQAPTTGTTPAGVSLRDAYMRWSRAPFAITAGQMMTPFSREWTMPLPSIETAERSIAVEALATKVDVGAMAEWTYGADFSLAAGAFNGEGQNVVTNRDSTTVFIGRIAGRPLAPLSLGGSIATYGADSTRYGVEAVLEGWGVSFRGEFLGQKRAGIDSRDEGWYGLITIRTLPWLSLVGRQEELHRPSYPANLALQRGTTVGLMSDLPGGRLRAILDYVRRRNGRAPVTGNSLVAQLQVKFF
jgi:hypothetical protein